jgi:hypothetical protein
MNTRPYNPLAMINALRAHKYRLIPVLLSLPLLAGCQGSGPSRMPTEPERRAMMSLMLPSKIKIEPFTKIASFDKDEIPDGLLVVLRPVDQFGDPVKATGLFYFELYSYQMGSSEREGQRLAFWDQTIDSPEKIAQHWTHAQMYEFKLGWPQGASAIHPGKKYLLSATYRTPWDETIKDEYVMEFTLPPGVKQPAKSPTTKPKSYEKKRNY